MTSLRFPPPDDLDCYVAVHEGATYGRARSNLLTQVAAIVNDSVRWTGAVGEELLQSIADDRYPARHLLASRLLCGSAREWSMAWPGLLTAPGVRRPLGTVYDGDRPWLILGELDNGALLAAPLNDARGNPRWWTPVVERRHVRIRASTKDSQVELAHLWSFPSSILVEGDLDEAARPEVARVVSTYYP